MNEINNKINNELNYIKFNLNEKAANNQMVVGSITAMFNRCNEAFNKLQKRLQSDLESNNYPSVLILDDVAELNRQLNQLIKTCQYFFGEKAEEIAAIKSLKKDISLFKARVKTLGFNGQMLEDQE